MIGLLRPLSVVVATLALLAGCSDDTSSQTPTDRDATATSQAPGAGSATGGDPALPAGMIRVEGTISGGTIDGVLDGPAAGPFDLQVLSPGGGNGAVINPVVIDGESRSIVWDGGRPLTLTGPDLQQLYGPWRMEDGALILDLSDIVVGLSPGAYTLVGPVAVGDPSGLASPYDRVSFDATAETALVGSGASSLVLQARRAVLLGPGTVDLQGSFTVTTADATVTASTIRIRDDSFELTVSSEGSASVSGLARGATWS